MYWNGILSTVYGFGGVRFRVVFKVVDKMSPSLGVQQDNFIRSEIWKSNKKLKKIHLNKNRSYNKKNPTKTT